MDLLSLLMILVRRWYVSVVVLAVTVAGLAYVYPFLKTDYQTTGTLLLSPPNHVSQVIGSQLTQVPVNPLLVNSSSGVQGAATTIAAEANSDAEKHLMMTTYGLTYTVVVDSHAPLVTVQGTAQSQDAVTQGVGALLAFLGDQLDRLQGKIQAPQSQLIASQVIVDPQVAVASSSARYKTLLILAFVGLLVACSLSFILDGIVVSLRYRRFIGLPAPTRRRATPAGAKAYRSSLANVSGAPPAGDGEGRAAQETLTQR